MDDLTPEQRKKNMRAIKSSETDIESILRKVLWGKGYRYRKNYKKIPGKPDIVFPTQKIAVFCDSEFWHGYDFDQFKTRIGTNQDYWLKKIQRNMERDKEITAALENNGWTVLRFWGKQIKKQTNDCVSIIEDNLLKRGYYKNGRQY